MKIKQPVKAKQIILTGSISGANLLHVKVAFLKNVIFDHDDIHMIFPHYPCYLFCFLGFTLLLLLHK